MAVRVLVVDDSGFFRRRVTEILDSDPQIEVVGAAVDGKDAIDKTMQLKPDVITMDIEMPVMDGITAVRRIMTMRPTPVLMFSSLTYDGAKATLDALDAGAVDFLPKRFDDISKDREEAKRKLCAQVRSVAKGSRPAPTPPPVSRPTAAARTPISRPASAPPPAAPSAPVRRGSFKLLAIGTSTGGPVALQKVLTALPANYPMPILLVQHMPGTFTPAFAARLDQLCNIKVKEAADGDMLQPGVALLAPGGKQMVIEGRSGAARVKITESDAGQFYKPCVDITFNSVAKIYPNTTLAVILTGMGADGREGCRTLKQGGSTVWSQDEASCVVYGMPMAVAEARITDRVVTLDQFGSELAGVV
ncbi:chemotaxis response regulator protein-glutamate methylesterase [Solemya pervernicosa gill symbiont]|uniref:Protein-glutamate methylesterase/protein-glutamine glutaminase n=2 Tax=Gammaproteobacteria incertae sedis TaxID=118884 RepID=A0A1T2LAW1_9GAMM|nr:chemotaxis response regulator protein-glutamate methylesterase [Solemya pervernicosa gill symbiont]OOZ42142.1 chemotaxis response regulator protein-glutamate methylesterase [Solemya pervernicosa gill symbiont]